MCNQKTWQVNIGKFEIIPRFDLSICVSTNWCICVRNWF